MPQNLIETFGAITKVETLTTIEHNILPNTLVLETVEPFPGYYERTLPDELKPHTIFLITKEIYPFEDVLRACQIVNAQLDNKYNLTFAELIINNSMYTSVRIIDLDNFKIVSQLQDFLIRNGIPLRKKKAINNPAKITIHKPFIVKELKNDIYSDMENPNMFYIELPEKIDWEDFEALTRIVKNNLSNRSFDAALGVFYRKKGIIDAVRLFEAGINLDRAGVIKEKYEKEFSRIVNN
jgi:hypothetical protein